MKPLDLLDDESAKLLGFDWLVKAVAPVSSYGVRRFAELVPFRTGSEAAAQSRAERIAEVAARLHPDRAAAARAAFNDLPDVVSVVARASMGEALDDPDFLELHEFCRLSEHLDASLESARLERIANEATGVVAAALERGRSGSGFYLADAFDAELAAARATFAKMQAELEAARGRESEHIAGELGRDEISGDEFIVLRSELRGELPTGVRIVRQAATYLLCALEYGESSLAALERRDAAAGSVAVLEERLRTHLSSVVRTHALGLSAAAGALGELDVLLGAVRYSHRYRCVAPVITGESTLAFAQGRFLPLEGELAVAGRRFVPIDLDLRGVAVLTGPNMGGKSVALQICGFLALCGAFGLPVPAARAEIGLFDHVAWLGTGLQERTGGLLSSFARELAALKAVFERSAPRLLILVDEFARTTTPNEGWALVVALARRLRERGAWGLVATHLQGIAAAAGVTHFAIRGLKGIRTPLATHDLSKALDALALSMDYTIAEVTGDDPPQADAIALAELLGLDREFVNAAYRALSQ